MLDTRLLITAGAVIAVISLATRWAPTAVFERREILDRLLGPALIGLAAARLAAAALDDRASLRSLRALLVIRGGVEFWAGVTVMLAALSWSFRRQHQQVWLWLAELAPFALWGYAAFEATCIIRDGCYGPVSAVGLVPDGLQTRMFPVGLAVAAAITGAGFAVRRLSALPHAAQVLFAVGTAAAARAVASFWLPHVGAGLSRQHLESIVIAIAVGLVGAAGAITGFARPQVRSDAAVSPSLIADERLSPDPRAERA